MQVIREEELRCLPDTDCSICNPGETKICLFGETNDSKDSTLLTRLYRHHSKVLQERGICRHLCELAVLVRKRCADPLCIYCGPPSPLCESLGNWVTAKHRHMVDIQKAITAYHADRFEIPEKLEGFEVLGWCFLYNEKWVFRKTEKELEIKGYRVRDLLNR